MQMSKEKKGFFAWIKDLHEKARKKELDTLNQKLEALHCQAYSHYLNIYIGDMVENARVDFHPCEYLSGRIICPFAKIKADEEIQAIKRQGPAKINKYYSILLKNARNAAKENKKRF